MTNSAIPNVIANRHVPLSDELTVVTRTDAIEIHHPDLGSLRLTIEQSVALRDRLGQAERDIDAAEPCEDGGALTEPARCDCCGRAMAIGEHVAVHWDERKGDVVLHVGKCPEPDRWHVAVEFKGRVGRSWLSSRPFEDAWMLAQDWRANPAVASVLLVRSEARS